MHSIFRPLPRLFPLALLALAQVLTAAPFLDSSDIARADELLEQMTQEEKIGQLIQLSPWEPTGEEFLGLVRAGQVGSFLNVIEPEAVRLIQKTALKESRLGIPLIIGRDIIHGFRTIQPIPLGLAATWNPAVIEEGSALAAREARSVGVNWTFAPMLDVTRDPRWGRIAESVGEDPFLGAALARAYVRGFQGTDLSAPDRIAACVKHFAGYGFSQAGKDYNTTWIPDQQLWETVLPPFKAAIDAGAATVMTAFNDLNGIPCSGNAFLFREVLRERWEFEGFVVSDWGSIDQMMSHGNAADMREAARLAALAGVDMEMASPAYRDHLAALVEEGVLGQEMIDEKVRNILQVKSALGLFENPYPAEGASYPPAVTDEARAIARRAAEESFVLLKNEESVLPLAEGRKIALIGPLADQPYEQLGTWSFDGAAEDSISVRAAFAELAAAGNHEVRFAAGLGHSRDRSSEGFAEAIAAAEAADVVVFVGGEEAILSGEAHSRAHPTLPGAQETLLHALARTGKPIVLVIMAGRPLILENVLGDIDALLYAWHPGTMAGPALANVLTGAVAPSGKLPVTFPRAVGQIPIFYSHRNTGRPFNPDSWVPMDEIPIGARQTSLGNESHYLDESVEPRFHFGEGLSYTTFRYTDARFSSAEVAVGETVEVSVALTNTGDVAGTEVAQLYLRDLAASITRPVRELKGFQKITLAPGETRTLTFVLGPEALAFPGPDGYARLEAGTFEVFVGGDSRAPSVGTFELR